MVVANEGRGHARSHQGRLPAARRTDHSQHPNRRQPAQALGDVGVASEEPVGVADLVGDQAGVRAGGRRFGAELVRGERGVLAEDRLFEGDQLRARVDPELGGQHRAGAMQRPQRLALPAGLVLRGREQGPPPLPQRRLGHPDLGLAQHVAVAARLQSGVDMELLGVAAQLLESGGLDLAGVPAVEIIQGAAPPQPQRLTGKMRGPFGLAQCQQLVCAAHQTFEPPGVDLVTGNDEPVAVGDCLDRFGAQRAPKAHDAAGYHLLPCGGGLLAPQRIGQSLGADHLARMHRERGQHHSISRCQPGRVAIDGQRAEHADARAPHGRSVRPASGLVNGTVTELLPRGRRRRVRRG